MSNFENGWKPYAGGKILCSREDLQKKKLKVEFIAGKEIVFAGDAESVAFLEDNDFEPVQNFTIR